MKLKMLTIAAGAIAIGFVTGWAQALPLTVSAEGVKSAADASSLTKPVDACNRVCRKGPVPEWGGSVRWHRHVGKACEPVKCTP